MDTDLTPQEQATVEMVCWIARSYLREGFNNFAKIADASGYQFKKDRIGPGEIEAELRRDPSLVADWLQWSEDKRCSPAWYFRESDGGFVVGYYHQDPQHRSERCYEDAFAACAQFIVYELEDY